MDINCLWSSENGEDLCIISELQPQISINEAPLLTEFDCSVLNLTNCLFIIPSSRMYSPVSVAHICSNKKN